MQPRKTVMRKLIHTFNVSVDGFMDTPDRSLESALVRSDVPA